MLLVGTHRRVEQLRLGQVEKCSIMKHKKALDFKCSAMLNKATVLYFTSNGAYNLVITLYIQIYCHKA